MKYMLIHCIDESAERARRAPEGSEGAPSIESWLEEMEGRGVLLHGDRLRYVSDATTVQVRHHGLLVSDGPFAETKEVICGYDVLDCANIDEAVKVAAAHPVAAFGRIEVRPFWRG